MLRRIEIDNYGVPAEDDNRHIARHPDPGGVARQCAPFRPRVAFVRGDAASA